MPDWPITFSAAMVHAVLEGRKTQTRRLAEGSDGASRWVRVQPGDTLWMREEWGLSGEFAGVSAAALARFHDPASILRDHLVYRASADPYDLAVQHWRQARHMPRWASRATLAVTQARRETLQGISAEDAIAEGLIRIHHGDGAESWHHTDPAPSPGGWANPVDAFADLWGRIHGRGAWRRSPEVIAISFQRESRA